MKKELCIICGAEIPEGRMICYHCERGDKPLQLTNGDKLRQMNNRDLAEWIVFIAGTVIPCDEESRDKLKMWLDKPASQS